MPVLLIVGPKCTLAASYVATWLVMMSLRTGQTDRRTDEWTPHGCITLSATRCQRNNLCVDSDVLLCFVLIYLFQEKGASGLSEP